MAKQIIRAQAVKAKVQDSSVSILGKARKALHEKGTVVSARLSAKGQEALDKFVGRSIAIGQRQLEALKAFRKTLG